jgi:hypothetical protein
VTRLLVTTIRNEAPYVLEWVAYHRMIGFDRILAYSNDCTDGTDTLLDALADRGLVIHERNEDYAKKGVQWTALERASSHPETRAADWVLFADIDEFVNVKAGAGRLDDLFAAVPQADAIALTWRLFGSAGTVEIADLPVIGQFTRAAPFPCHAPWTASQFKTLFRNDGAYRKLGVHRPKSPDPKRKGGIRWVNGSGKVLPAAFEAQAAVTYGEAAGMDLVCLNHYSVKSAMAYLAKTTRGLPNRSDKAIDLGYWADRNFNEVEETSILRHLPALRAELAALRAEAELDRLTREGLAWHRARALELMDTLEGLQLLTRIVGTERRDVDPTLARALLKKRIELRARMKGED